MVDASTEESVEQTNGNTFVFEGVTLTRAPPLQHVSELQCALPLSVCCMHHLMRTYIRTQFISAFKPTLVCCAAVVLLPLLQTAANKNANQGASWQTAVW